MRALLKQRTRATHERVEADLDLLDPGLTTVRLAAVLSRFQAFWDAAERALEPLATSPLAADLDWARRRRGPVLDADVRALGGQPVPFEGPVPVGTPAAGADLLGWLYVAEGSTLGGAVIARRLAPLLRPLGVEVHSFTPYPEGPGPMWRSYQDALERWVGDDTLRRHAVAASAVQAFAALHRWLAPVRRDAVA